MEAVTRFASRPAAGCLIDSHCHLDAPELAGDVDGVVARARAAGVGQLLVPAVTAGNFDAVLAMRQRYGCWIAFGLHPIYLSQHLDDHLALLDAALAAHAPVAVGEIGLDFYLPELDPMRQEALLVEQLKLARKHGLPAVLHVRRSVDRVLKHLREQKVEGGIAHAFNGSEQQAEAFIRQGFKLGFGGAMTYSGSRRIRALAATLPLDSLVLETDAPDIRPEYAQDVPNEPAQLARFITVLAELRGMDVSTLRDALHANTLAALGLI
ncbi:TatD family hydrolase [Chromobacterium amazonense]|uniref:TatD family hydrolase n=1 Tax=Chromobacterium amazonense TaxID=1382803 RepID=A0ABU8UX28_9NEIS|nr:TatD family hydrolase [Chromobacterium amazonense]MDQ4539108.1 TatD family hydrolase [Chromobacterium amazonense]